MISKVVHFSFNRFVLGLFFLTFATHFYSILGIKGKYLSLVLGMGLLITNYSFIPLLFKRIGFLLLSFLYFVLLITIAFLLNQKTSETLMLAFDIICLTLFYIGYSVGKLNIKHLEISKKVKYLISALAVIGSYFTFKIMIQTSIGHSSRHIEDENLNANGIAYVCALLFLLILWLIRKEKKIVVKLSLIVGLVAISFNLLLTESRGAMLFLLFTILLSYFNRISKFFNIKIISIGIASALVFIYLYQTNEVVSSKIDNTAARFEKVIENQNTSDKSSTIQLRLLLLKDFYENYDEMLLGQAQYKPYPHNQFIEMYMRWGILSFPLIFVSLYCFKKVFKFLYAIDVDKNSLSFLIVSLFLFSFLQSMSSMNLENNRLLWLGFGFLLSYRIKK